MERTGNPMQNKTDTIKLLAGHELAISRLYKKYAEILPEHKDFWTELAREETEHAKCILELLSRVADGSISFDEERFNVSDINRSLRFIEEMRHDSEKPDFVLKHALSAAHYLEESLIENEHFKVFESDEPAFRQVMELLAKATSEHRDKVRTALEQCD